MRVIFLVFVLKPQLSISLNKIHKTYIQNNIWISKASSTLEHCVFWPEQYFDWLLGFNVQQYFSFGTLVSDGPPQWLNDKSICLGNVSCGLNLFVLVKVRTLTACCGTSSKLVHDMEPLTSLPAIIQDIYDLIVQAYLEASCIM